MEFTKEQITFIMQCVFNACELFNDEYDAIEEELVSFVYDHVADVIEAKIDAAYELLKACSKSLSAEIQAMQTFKVGG